ncbi:gas vesicle protein GvpG [Rhodococcus sp. WAY2]|uniref:gas vesicle protein GvpG n=1 Tax=Rhodococcus sp. WAY2 TaxID=2663121 RepID=UPI00131F8C1D|nr:gas vesicle protein GvpG [Rhodococcus sp. WAY2]QHE67026.1 putative gas vesicle synthesis protein [Rhodococcus sp. WAY2]
MGLLSFVFTLPLAPVRGVISLAEVIQRQVEQEMHNPATARRELEELEEARERGDITAEEEEQAQQAILDRMTSGAATRPENPQEE